MGSEEAGNKILPNQKLFQISFGEAMRGDSNPELIEKQSNGRQHFELNLAHNEFIIQIKLQIKLPASNTLMFYQT